MARIIQPKAGKAAEGEFGAARIHVRGLPYENTAAKFWTCLFDEVAADRPECNGVTLAAATGGLLVPELLNPESVLQKNMNRLEKENLETAFEDALAVLDVLGPPPGVLLRLLAKGQQTEAHEVALDYLDADILPFLIVWLLEWCGIPEILWNEERVRGAFMAEDRDRGFTYRVATDLAGRHLSESLFHREVTVRFSRERAPCPAAEPSPPPRR